KVGVNLGGSNGLVAQHLLHRPQISPPFYQMGSERVPKGVGADIFIDTGLQSQVFYQIKNGHSAHFTAALVKEKMVSAIFGHMLQTAYLVYVNGYIFHGIVPDRHHTLLIAFASNTY